LAMLRKARRKLSGDPNSPDELPVIDIHSL
jgi:hypothetical protein